jgi:hypothetical protein
MPQPCALESLVRASVSAALDPAAKRQQHQLRDAERPKIQEKLVLHCRVSNPASSLSETSMAGSFLHAAFEIRQNCTIAAAIGQRLTKVQPMNKTPHQQRSGGRGSSNSSLRSAPARSARVSTAT